MYAIQGEMAISEGHLFLHGYQLIVMELDSGGQHLT